MSTSLRPSLIFSVLTVTFLVRSLINTVYVLVVRRSMDKYIVISHDIASQNIVGHATLEEGTRALESHKYPRPLEKSILSNECSVFIRIRMELCLMIACGEVSNAKRLRLQHSDSVDDLLDIRNGSSFQCFGG